MQAFPLQNKRMQSLVTPYIRAGTCEVMNAAPHFMNDSFHAFNTKNTAVYRDFHNSTKCSTDFQQHQQQPPPREVPFMGQLIAGGLVDSYTGGAVSNFVAKYLARALSIHTIDPKKLRELRREFPDDPLVDLMSASAQRQRALQPAVVKAGATASHLRSRGAAMCPLSGTLRSIVTDVDMQQYAVSADAAFFKACDTLSGARRSLLDGIDGGDDDTGTANCEGSRLSSYEWRIAATLAAALKTASANTSTHPEAAATEATNTTAVDAAVVSDAKNSGCRAVWFSATVVPSAMELQRRLVLLSEARGGNSGSSSYGEAPPPRRTLADPATLAQRELTSLHEVAQAQPYCLDVLVSNVGDARAFGIARNKNTLGTRSQLDPTRERVVPLSIDHKPFRQEEFHRITQAGGCVESVAGEVIDGNPFYNVSRSFGHWTMKSNPRRSPVQQKLSAVPHTASWRMLAGDVLVLANHAVFETRREDDSSVDEVARLVGRELDRGATAEQTAAAVCDFAVRFGAPHTLQVMVVVATLAPSTARSSALVSPTDAEGPAADREAASEAPQAPPVAFKEWVEPGPLYVEACRNLRPLRDAFARDCARCGLSPADMIGRRWERVRALLPLRHALRLMPYYGRECGALQQIMDEEARFFDYEALRMPTGGIAEPGAAAAPQLSAPEVRSTFARLARTLMSGKK